MPVRPFCPSRRPPLSFPPVFSGNPESFSSVPSFVWPCMGKGMDSRLKTSGMTWAGIVWPRMREALDSASLLACPLWPLCHARRTPLALPPVPSGTPARPLCHSRRFLAGIQCLSLLFLSFVWPCMGKALDSRLETSGMTWAGIVWPRTREALDSASLLACPLWPLGMPVRPLWHARRPPLACPPAPSGTPAGPLWHSRRSPFVMPVRAFCHARRPPLSFPPVFSGNPVFFSSVPVIRVALHGKRHGFPIKNVGNDMGRNRVAPHERSPGFCKPFGMPALAPCHARQTPLSCPSEPSVMPAGPPLSFPPVFSGNPVFFSSVPSFVWSCMGKGMDSRLKTSGMTWAGIVWPSMGNVMDSRLNVKRGQGRK